MMEKIPVANTLLMKMKVSKLKTDFIQEEERASLQQSELSSGKRTWTPVS